MKIKFIDPMYANYTGTFGTTEFVDGTSVTSVSRREAELYGAIAQIEVLEGDSIEFNYDDIKDVAATSFNLPTQAELDAAAAAAAPAEEAVEDAVDAKFYTKDELEAIADKSGLAGLRAIGDSLGVRSTSISKLIAAILAKQAPAKPAAEFIPAPDVAVSVTIDNEDR